MSQSFFKVTLTLKKDYAFSYYRRGFHLLSTHSHKLLFLHMFSFYGVEFPARSDTFCLDQSTQSSVICHGVFNWLSFLRVSQPYIGTRLHSSTTLTLILVLTYIAQYKIRSAFRVVMVIYLTQSQVMLSQMFSHKLYYTAINVSARACPWENVNLPF